MGFFSTAIISSNTVRVFSLLHYNYMHPIYWKYPVMNGVQYGWVLLLWNHLIFDWQSFRFVCCLLMIFNLTRGQRSCTMYNCCEAHNSQCINIIAANGNFNEICFLYSSSNQPIVSIQFNCKFCAGAGDRSEAGVRANDKETKQWTEQNTKTTNQNKAKKKTIKNGMKTQIKDKLKSEKKETKNEERKKIINENSILTLLKEFPFPFFVLCISIFSSIHSFIHLLKVRTPTHRKKQHGRININSFAHNKSQRNDSKENPKQQKNNNNNKTWRRKKKY